MAFRLRDTSDNTSNIFDTLITDIIDEKSNVKNYGAVGDGITDDTQAIISAANYASSLYFPEGTYRVTSQITISKSNFTIMGRHATIAQDPMLFIPVFQIQGQTTPVLVTSSSVPITEGSFQIVLDNATGVMPGDWCYITSTQNWYWTSGAWETRKNVVEISSISGNTATLATPILVPIDSGITITVYRPIDNIRIQGIRFQSKNPSQPSTNNAISELVIGVQFFNTKNIYITDCIFQNFSGFGVSFTYSLYCNITQCHFIGVPFTNIDSTTYIGVNCNICHNVNTVNCSFYYERVSVQTANTSKCNISHCSAINNRFRFVQFLQGSVYCSVINNWVYSREGGFINCVGLPISLVTRNKVYCGPNSNATFVDIFLSGDPSNSPSSLAYSSMVTNNVFDKPGSTFMQIGNYYSSLVVTNNIFTCREAMVIRSVTINRAIISNNIINLTSQTTSSDGIRFEGTFANIQTRKNIIVTDNIIRNYGRNAVYLLGTTSASRQSNQIMVANNIADSSLAVTTARALYTLEFCYFGSDIAFKNNTIIGTTNNQSFVTPNRFFEGATNISDRIMTGLPKTTHVPNIVGYGNSIITAIPDGATVEQGCIILNTEPLKGDSFGWICQIGGTQGSLVGVNATVLNGTTVTLTGNSLGVVYRGCFIIVNSVQTRVVNISDDFVTATVDTSVGVATGTFPVSYRSPTFRAMAPIADLITSAYGINSGSTDMRNNSTAVGSLTLTQTASKLTNLISDLRTAGYLL